MDYAETKRLLKHTISRGSTSRFSMQTLSVFPKETMPSNWQKNYCNISSNPHFYISLHWAKTGDTIHIVNAGRDSP